MKLRDTLIYAALIITSLNVVYVYLQLSRTASGINTVPMRVAMETGTAAPAQVQSQPLPAQPSVHQPGKRVVGKQLRLGEPEIWARPASGKARIQLPPDLHQKSLALCARCLYKTLMDSTFVYGRGDRVFIATGDIPDMWIRDSSVQLGVLLPRIKGNSYIQSIIEGAINMQAYYINNDPYANSYRQNWIDWRSLSKFERQLGRGGWVSTRNYELDSGAYFFNLLWNYYHTVDWGGDIFLRSTLIASAVKTMLRVWHLEQNHTNSGYRYSELPNDGMGKPVGITGLSWSGFRPSDDQQTYPYNIPVNMYAAGALARLAQLNEVAWQDEQIAELCKVIGDGIKQGVDKFGTVDTKQGPIYAYEVDGLGNALHSFDDPNVPSLLSIPLLGFSAFNHTLYANTRKVILSHANSHYFSGSVLKGLGSPHTPQRYVWSLGLITQALTTQDDTEVLDVFKMLLQTLGSNGLLHESNDVDNPNALTRPLFQWANSMFVVLFEQMTGQSCTEAADKLYWQDVMSTEASTTSSAPNGGQDQALYYALLNGHIKHP